MTLVVSPNVGKGRWAAKLLDGFPRGSQWQDGEGAGSTLCHSHVWKGHVLPPFILCLKHVSPSDGPKASIQNEEVTTSDKCLGCGMMLQDLVSPAMMRSKLWKNIAIFLVSSLPLTPK